MEDQMDRPNRKKENQGSASTACNPARLVLVLFLQVVRYGKGNDRPGRERTRAKDAAAIFASSSPLFCSLCCLHLPHHRQQLTTSPASVSAQGEGRADTSSASGRCYRHHIATTSAPIDQQQGSASTVCHPARLVHVPAIFARSSLLSVALTVHAIARSSLPSSSAVPVILRPDLVRSFSSVCPSVFLFLVPRSPSC